MPGFGSQLTEANFNKLDKWQEFARTRGYTVEQLAISWLLAHPYIDSVIAGVTSAEQVTAHVKAADWKLTNQELT